MHGMLKITNTTFLDELMPRNSKKYYFYSFSDEPVVSQKRGPCDEESQETPSKRRRSSKEPVSDQLELQREHNRLLSDLVAEIRILRTAYCTVNNIEISDV